MTELKSWPGYLSVLLISAVAGMSAYLRPVPRSVCEERHLHLAEDVA